jgi:flagellar hook assembly protein FlgD
VDIYNVKGRLVRRYEVAKEQLNTMNSIVWNGTDADNNAVASGVYFTRVTSGDVQQSRKMMLIK